MAKDKRTKVSIYLLKEKIAIEEAIKNLKKDPAEIGGGELYYRESFPNTPSWVETFFDNGIDEDRFKSQSSSIIYVRKVNINGNLRTFLLPFGYGHTMLNDIYCVDDFGLKLVLNIVESDTLKKISTKSLTSDPKNTTEQFSGQGETSGFGFDIEQDLLEEVTGKTKEEYTKLFGKGYVTGKTGFSISKKINIHNLEDFLRTCFKLYNKDSYKENFDFIDNIQLIKNTEELDNRIVAHINNEIFNNEIFNNEIFNNEISDNNIKLWLAIPEIIEWPNVSGFSFTNKNDRLVSDISYDNFQDALLNKRKKEFDLKDIKDWKVTAFREDTNQKYKNWSLYKCLCGEVSYPDEMKKKILSNGKWYNIEESFVKKVEDSYEKIMGHSYGIGGKLKNAERKEREDAYNLRMSQDRELGLIHMDNELIPYGGGPSKVEFCDLYDPKEKTFYHIKKYSSSRALSHLFAQGRVSGQLFLRDSEFRGEVMDRNSSLNLEDSPKASDYKIVYGIISNREESLNLPFFSKVNLRNEEKFLRYAYFDKVYLVKIQEDNPK